MQTRNMGLVRVMCLAVVAGFSFGAVGDVDTQTGQSEVVELPAVISPDLPVSGPVRDDLDAYGGWTKLKGRATGYFHVEQLGGRWWFLTPEGNAYFMLEMGWAGAEDTPRLKSWGFNASEPDTGMPYAVNLRMFRLGGVKQLPVARSPHMPPWVTFPDVFDPAWPDLCRAEAERRLAPHANDPLLLGYYLENEIAFGGWYEAVMRTPKDAPGRTAFIAVARAYYADKADALARDWQQYGVTKLEDLMNVEGPPPNVPELAAAWDAAVAEKAFSVAAGAAKAAAPNHICLGTRMINAPLPSPGILTAIAKYCDVVSLNLYSPMPDRLLTQIFTLLPAIHALTGRPTLTSEISYRGGDTTLPNTMGAMPTVKSQAERAIGYLSYVSAVASLPHHIGVAWYKYSDDKPDVEWNAYAEDCNFGVVDGRNRPYAVLTEGMRATNRIIYELAADPVQNPACPLFYRTELMRWDRPGDEILLQRLMHAPEPFVDPLAQALPEPRRYHEHYWVRYRSPNLTVNDDRFVGWCQANIVKTGEDGQKLVLFNVQAFTSFPRQLWFGPQCTEPDKALTLESNAQYLLRHVNAQGRLVRMTLADGSFARLEFGSETPFEFRLDKKTAYMDLEFRPESKQVEITTRGAARRLGLPDVAGWQFTWNGAPLVEGQIAQEDALTMLTMPR